MTDYSGLVERTNAPTLAEGFRGFAAMIRSGAMAPEDHEMVAAKFDEAADAIKRLTAELAQATATSEGRLKVLNEKANEARSEWIRAERAEAALAEAKTHADELQQTFDLRWKADQRAIKRWQDATGEHLSWPDRADLVVWLHEERAAALAEAKTACERYARAYEVTQVQADEAEAALAEAREENRKLDTSLQNMSVELLRSVNALAEAREVVLKLFHHSSNLDAFSIAAAWLERNK